MYIPSVLVDGTTKQKANFIFGLARARTTNGLHSGEALNLPVSRANGDVRNNRISYDYMGYF